MQGVRTISPSPGDATLAINLTLPLGGSRGTSGEGLIFQLHPPQTMLPQPTNSLAPAPWQARLEMNLTLPLGGSRGTSGDGLISQLHPSLTMLPQPTTSVAPPLGKQHLRTISPSPWEGKKTISPSAWESDWVRWPSNRRKSQTHPFKGSVVAARGRWRQAVLRQVTWRQSWCRRHTRPPEASADPEAQIRNDIPTNLEQE